MVKKISCRVVRSVPLSRSSDARLWVNQPDKKPHKFRDATVVNVGVRRTGNSLIYTARGDTVRVPIGNGPTERILDCYA